VKTLKEKLCETFCGTLSVNSVPVGLAVGTAYEDIEGDQIGFYVVGPDHSGKYRIEDDGLYIPVIEAFGADLANKTRAEVFHSLLEEYSVEYDEENAELTTEPLPETEIPSAALRFLGFLLRVQDLIFMASERAASTFKQDAMRQIKELVKDRARLEENYAVHTKLKEFPADLGIVASGRPPVAVFFGLSESKLYEALLLQAYALNEQVDCSVVALLETESVVSKKVRQRGANHLDAMPVYRGDEDAACMRVVHEAIGRDASRLH